MSDLSDIPETPLDTPTTLSVDEGTESPPMEEATEEPEIG